MGLLRVPGSGWGTGRAALLGTGREKNVTPQRCREAAAALLGSYC